MTQALETRNEELPETQGPRAGEDTAVSPSHDEIAARAYELFLQGGCVDGRDVDNWLQAEKDLCACRPTST